MVVAWLPNIISYFVGLSLEDDDGYIPQLILFVNLISEGWGVLYGSFLAIVFFANSSEARRRWYNMTIRRLVADANIDLSSSESCVEIIMEDSDVLETAETEIASDTAVNALDSTGTGTGPPPPWRA